MPAALSTEESKELAKHIVDHLIIKLSDEETVKSISNVWGKYLDQWIGRGFRRLLFYVLVVAVVMGAVKLQVWNYMFK